MILVCTNTNFIYTIICTYSLIAKTLFEANSVIQNCVCGVRVTTLFTGKLQTSITFVLKSNPNDPPSQIEHTYPNWTTSFCLPSESLTFLSKQWTLGAQKCSHQNFFKKKKKQTKYWKKKKSQIQTQCKIQEKHTDNEIVLQIGSPSSSARAHEGANVFFEVDDDGEGNEHDSDRQPNSKQLQSIIQMYILYSEPLLCHGDTIPQIQTKYYIILCIYNTIAFRIANYTFI